MIFQPVDKLHAALSESLDGFLEIRESAVLAHDLISPTKFLEQEYSDCFCLL
jgi:hypothetical protein